MNYFHKYYITNGTDKTRVHYSPNVSTSTGKNCITAYSKDYNHNLSKIFSDVRNDSDIMTDYFEEDRVTFLEGSKEYSQLLPLLKSWGFAR